MNKQSLNAAAYQQLLAQELGLSKKRIVKKQNFNKNSNSQSKNRKSISNLTSYGTQPTQDHAEIYKKLERYFFPKLNIKLNQEKQNSKISRPLLIKNAGICNWMIKRLMSSYDKELKSTSTSYETVKNLADYLDAQNSEMKERKDKTRTPISDEKLKTDNQQKITTLLNLAHQRKNLKACPICLEYLDPFNAIFSITACCTSVFHTKCLKSIINLAGQRSFQSLSEHQSISRRIEERAKFSVACPVCRAGAQGASSDKHQSTLTSQFKFHQITPSCKISLKIITLAAIKIQSHFKGHLYRINSSAFKIKWKCSRVPRIRSLENRIKNEKTKLLTDIDQNLKFQSDLIKQFEKLHVNWEEIRANSLKNGWYKTCSICMEPNFVDFNQLNQQMNGDVATVATSAAITSVRNQKVKILHCGHCFHEVCLGSWIIYKDLLEVCPLCRENFFSEDLCF